MNRAVVCAVVFSLFSASLLSANWIVESEVVDDTVDAGLYNSIAVDATGTVHIAYYDATYEDIKHAEQDGSGGWSSGAVDSAGDVGSYCSIAVDSSGTPHISYHYSYDITFPFPMTLGKLKYVSGANGTPVIVDGNISLYAKYTSIALNSSGEPRIAYHDATSGTLYFIAKIGSSWGTRQSVESGGKGASVVLDSSGNPHIAHVNGTVLRYVFWNGSSWIKTTAADYQVEDERTSIALDSNGYPHIVYVNVDGLRYVYWDGSDWIDELAHWINNGPVGISSPSLALNSNDEPFISFHGNLWGDQAVVVAVRNGVNDWSTPAWLLSDTTPGGQTSITVGTNDILHVSFHDASTGELGYAKVMEDSDNDWLPDWWEMKYFQDLDEGSFDDPDGDNWDNAYEYEIGTDPSVSDAVNNSWDRDGDGLSNDDETNTYGTDPDDPDSDDDGLNDGVEVGYHAFWENFEESTIDEVWTTGGDQPWQIDSSESQNENQSARSGSISHGQTSYLEMEVVLQGEGHISFWYRTSCETGSDYLHFSTNGTTYASYSGSNDWPIDAAEGIPAGTNTFRWTYEKDASGSTGDDAVWLDAVYVGVDAVGTSPTNSDYDADGLLDGEEVNIYGTDPLLADSDNDGLNDSDEINVYGTDPNLADTDLDLMPDGWEVTYMLNPTNGTDAAVDIEPDGLTNLEEFQNGTNPRVADTDTDGMPDGWEVDNTLMPTNSADATVDIEPDGLTNLEEFQNGTDPRVVDTDTDGMPDGWEVDNTLMPTNSADATVDIEPDGLTNLEEFQNGTNPRVADSDNDGMLDGYEVRYGLDPLLDDANVDADNDGLTNIEEHQHGTNPNTADTDADGLTDINEINTIGTNPTLNDSDSDGLPDGQETVGTGVLCIGFEDGTLPAGSSGAWSVHQINTIQGTNAASANNCLSSQLDYTVETTNGTGSFWYYVDTLISDNEYQFLVNDSPKLISTSNESWTNFSFSLPAGTNKLTWKIRKTGGLHNGDEVFAIDLISLPVVGTGSCPTNSDTDADGIFDGEEVNTYNTDPGDEDSDNDGLNDGEEVNTYGTNPNLADTDLDLMPDGWEVMQSLNPTNGTDAAVDIEPDGLSNLEEYQNGTDPRDEDSDNDLMPDGWEVTYTLNPTNGTDAAVDVEPDGLSNLEEYQAGTNPNNSDTDADGLNDGDEVNTYETLALDDDTDNDGLKDGAEVNTYSSNPKSTDSDGDTLLDGYEVNTLGTSPTKKDTDDDGLDDNVETDTGTFVSSSDTGTDPLDSDTDDDGALDGVETDTGFWTDISDRGTDPFDPDTDNDNLFDGAETHTGIYSNQLNAGSNPFDTDTDDDTLSDGDEVLVHHTDPNKADSDDDGLTDPDEINTHNTNPSDPDTDNDGLNDGDEIYNLTEFRESFEESAIPDGWTTGGYANWTGETGDVYDGTNSVVSGTIYEGDESWIQLSIKTWTNNLTFYSRTYGYWGDDHLEIRVDGSLKYARSGNMAWLQTSIPLTAGEHIIQWKFYREVSDYVPGGARGLIDLVELMQWDNTDPQDPDSDDDGVSDGDEVHTYGTGPNNTDSDNDGMDDGYEVDNLLNPLVDDTAGDADGDGLNNGDEYLYGSNAQVKDSDGDGIEDGTEVHTYGSDPMDTDSDDDGLEDGVEVALGTTLIDADTDNDGLSDGDEVNTYGTLPLVFDTDNDGLSDGVELISMVYSNSFEAEYFDYRWTTTGASDWEISTTWPYEGSQHASSSVLYLETNVVSVTINTDSGNIQFAELVAMETGGKARFFINGIQQEVYFHESFGWGWVQKSYPVQQGTNTFKWVVENWSNESGYFALDKLSVPMILGTSALDDDSDGDGVKDGVEVNQYRCNPLSTDSDGDGLDDGEEINTYGTNPNLADSDNDGMTDGWETDNLLAPTNSDDAAVDIEPDGLTNLEEFQNGTNPRVVDTDTDGMLDGYEVTYGLNPLSNDADLDPDSDGLTNLEEHSAGTNPKSGDTDSDSMPDGWEVDNTLMPTNSADAAVDIEPDGLTNLEEFQNGTNPRVADTDTDGMWDGWEIDNALIPTNSTDAASDIEPDGLTNLGEFQNGTDPRVADTDSDNMPDGWEVSYTLMPTNNADATVDIEPDGLTNLEEYQNGTHPRVADTDNDGLDDGFELNTSNTDPLDADHDNDGMIDGWEWDNFLDPRVDDASGDADNDGLTNLQEAQAGTNPRSTDSDSDGMTDGWEADHSLDPAVNDAGGDPDNDGYTNRHEFDNGTDPQVADIVSNKSEFFRVVSDSPTVITGFTPDGWLTWSNSVMGATCRVERATSLVGAAPQPASLSMGLKLDLPGGDESNWTTNSEVVVTNLMMNIRCFFPDIKANMAFIPAGYFNMGDHLNEGYANELPVHSVYVSAFKIGKYVVKYEEIIEVMQWAYDNGRVYNTFHDFGAGEFLWGINHGANELLRWNNVIYWEDDQYKLRSTGGTGYPALVSWYGAIAYCNFLSEIEGLEPCYDLSDDSCDYSKNGYRLPTEAEWEKAARGGLYLRFAGFNTISHAEANYEADPVWFDYDYNPVSGYHPDYNEYYSPVGSFAPNGYGLFDMTGNTLEWCGDWYDEDYYSNSPVNDPRGPTLPVAVERVARGGGYGASPYQCRVSWRVGRSHTTSGNTGFRVVRSLRFSEYSYVSGVSSP